LAHYDEARVYQLRLSCPSAWFTGDESALVLLKEAFAVSLKPLIKEPVKVRIYFPGFSCRIATCQQILSASWLSADGGEHV
jgi:hypothetical protein